MANTRYAKMSQAMLEAALSGEDVIVALVAGSVYTPQSTDEFYDDIAGGAVIAESGALQNMTFTDGVWDADDIIVSAVPSGVDVTYLVFVIDSGSPATSRLFGRIDTGTGLPLTPNDGDVNLSWSSGSNKIHRL